MPFETLRIVPSVDIEKTLSDNAAGISYSNFIRWRDKVPEKRGGSKYFTGTIDAPYISEGMTCTIVTVGTTNFVAIGAASNTVGVTFTATGAGTGTGTVNNLEFGKVRSLHAWQGLSNFKFLAIGTEGNLFIYYYDAITGKYETKNITPKYVTVNINSYTGAFNPGIPNPPSPVGIIQYVGPGSTTSSDFIHVRDPGRNAGVYDTVVFNTQAAIPPFGAYGANGENFGTIIPSKGYDVVEVLSASEYTIKATNNYHPGYWDYGLLPWIVTTNGSPTVTVYLQGHTYEVGDAVDFNVSTTLGGVTIYGRYIVTESKITQNTSSWQGPPPYPTGLGYTPTTGYFKFNIDGVATSTDSAFMNYQGATKTVGYLNLTYWSTIVPGQTPISGLTKLNATDYWLDNWGEELITNPANGPIFTWSVNSGFNNAKMISDAPIINAGSFVAMPQQMIMAWGSTYTTYQDPLQIRWSDAGNYNDWTPTTNNQAGGFHIPTGSKIVRGIQGPTQQYWWTDIDLYVSQYVGTPFVFGFNKIGSGCGLIAPRAVGQMGPTLYWMSQKQFYSVSSTGGVQPIPCSVWDYVFQNLNESYTDNIRCAPNSQFNEITWFYPGGIGQVTSVADNGGGTIKVTLNDHAITLTTGMSVTLSGMSVSAYNGTYTITSVVGDPNSFTVTAAYVSTATGSCYSVENDSYVTYNVLYNEWDVGKLGRSAWTNQSIFGAPIAADVSGHIYQHDVTGIYNLGNDDIAINAYFETGYFSLTNGNDLVFVDWMLPDMKWDTYDGSQTDATIKISFNVTDYPGDTPTTYGPFTVTQATEYIEPRFRGRYMQIIVESDDSDSFWRLGSIRYRYASSGRR